MLGMIKGQTVKLHIKTVAGQDAFGMDEYIDTVVNVDNVLISPTASEDIVNEMQMYGKHSVYTLSIPKGDNHVWEDTQIEFFDKVWKSFGPITEYQEELVPLDWNKKVKVELYE